MEPADDDDDESAGREGYRGAKLAAQSRQIEPASIHKRVSVTRVTNLGQHVTSNSKLLWVTQARTGPTRIQRNALIR